MRPPRGAATVLGLALALATALAAGAGRVAAQAAPRGGSSAPAAQPDRPFSWLRFGAGVADMTPRLPEGGDYWHPEAGPVLRLETPLRPGLLSLGAAHHGARAGADVTDPSVARLGWTLVWLGWGAEAPLGRVGLGAEARLGTLVSAAPDGAANPVERELLLGGAAWVNGRLLGGLSVRAEAAALRVYARHPWSPLTLSVGLTQRLGVAPGLQRALAEPPPPGPAEPPPTPRAASRSAAPAAAERAWRPPPPTWLAFADLPGLAWGAEGVGTDRVDQRWSPGGLRGPEAGAPVLWLDGFPVRDATLGGPAWSWLPFGAADLAGLDAVDRPALWEGRPELEGILHATTRPPPRGRVVRARGLILNESRDPGPLRFTPLTSPNVDGPLYEADGAFGHRWDGGWLSVTGVRRERWSVTRRELRDRNPAFFRGSSSRVRTDGASVGVRQRVGAATLRSRVWGARGDRYLRAPALSDELSADVRHVGGGASLALPVAASDSVHVHLSATGWRARSPNEADPAADPRVLDWRERDLDAGVRYRAVRGATALAGGVDVLRATDGRARLARSGTSGRVYASAERALGPWRLGVGGALGGEAFGSGALVRVGRALGIGLGVDATASLHAGGRGSAFALRDHGVADPGLWTALGVAVGDVAPQDPGRRATVRVDASLARGGWEAALGAFVHRFGGERRPAVVHAWAGDVVRGAWGPVEAGAGTVLGLSGEVRTPEAFRLPARATVQLLRPRGTGAFDAWWSGAPRLTGALEGRLALREGWALVGLVRVRSAVEWAGFEAVEPRGAVPGGGRLPWSVNGDVRMVGALLGGRLGLIAGVSNLLDRDVRRHPLGAGEARGLVVGLETVW